MIETLISNLVFLIIGFYFGTKAAQTISVKEVGEKTVVRVKDLLKPKSDLKPGLIKRPSAGEVYQKNKPKEKKESDEAMRETLSKIPEIEERRKQVEELSREGVL